MANSLTVRNSIKFVKPFLKNAPVEVTNEEPAIGAANMVLGLMLAPPLFWRFNRYGLNFPINGSTTDYSQPIAAFGFIENAWLVDGAGKYHAMNGATRLAVDGSVGRPEKIAPQFDDNSGNIVFRVDKTPNAAYTAFIEFQAKAPTLASVAQLWAPMPDEFSYIFNMGFLSLLSIIANDSRFPIWENYFIARLLGSQDGLSDQDRNIFLGNWLALTQTLKRSDAAVSVGSTGRAKS
jgi:hypothetical protein